MNDPHMIQDRSAGHVLDQYRGVMRLSGRLTAIMIVTTALSLTGCGRKGALEDPPNTAAGEQAPQARPASPVASMPVPKSKTEKPKVKLPPPTPFILDPLL